MEKMIVQVNNNKTDFYWISKLNERGIKDLFLFFEGWLVRLLQDTAHDLVTIHTFIFCSTVHLLTPKLYNESRFLWFFYLVWACLHVCTTVLFASSMYFKTGKITAVMYSIPNIYQVLPILRILYFLSYFICKMIIWVDISICPFKNEELRANNKGIEKIARPNFKIHKLVSELQLRTSQKGLWHERQRKQHD